MTVRVRAATDLGLKRTINEDRLATWPPDGAAGERGILLVIADGMGGASGGEIASQLTIDSVVQHYKDSADGILEALKSSLETANHVVHEQSRTSPDLRGMGTTCTAVVVSGGTMYFAHVGDSRAYLVRKGTIRQLTQDHSLVAQLVQTHQLTPEEARVDPRRNVVTRSIGVSPQVEVDAAALDDTLAPGDTLVLCTDGLHGLVTDEEIARGASQPDLDRCCRSLIELAKLNGGHDNITLIVARIDA